MRTRNRRRLDKVLLAGGGLVVGGAAVAGALLGDTERIREIWVSAEVGQDGSAQVTEVIDYDFGGVPRDRHGIRRLVPGLAPGDPIAASSPDAPDDVQVTPTSVSGQDGVEIRVGDPNTTISGRHRYNLEFDLPGVERDGTLDWEAVGTEWPVSVERAEVHVVTPYVLADARCFTGGFGSDAGCDITEVEPGHLVAVVEDLDASEGVSIEGRADTSQSVSPSAPAPPTEGIGDPGTGLLPPGALAVAGLAVAAVPVMLVVRRAGRERVGAGGAADAAFAGTGPPGPGEVRLDPSELEQMATTEFAPPEGVSPAQGGIVVAEAVRPEHKTAWLIQAAIDGAVDLQEEGPKDVRLTRLTPGTPEQARILDQAFDGRDVVELGSYDKDFARGWSTLGSDLEDWRRNSGLWDQKGGTRMGLAIGLGILVGIAGLAVAGVGGAVANRWGAEWLPVAVIGGLIAGAGLTAAITSWELRVRTPAGSALWLRVESFRRFLAGSEAYHAEEAARRGVLREYTAWALAVGEIDRWAAAVGAATAIPADAGLGYVYMAPLLLMSTSSTSTQPQSSSSGGGFGGSFGGGGVGGGAGGGGGGSW
jgi:hypothetical protein